MIDLMSPGRRGVYTSVLLAAPVVLPSWLEMPRWFRDAAEPLGQFLAHQHTLGLFIVIFLEELGIPLPAPGDVAIAWAGYQTTTGSVPYALAYLAVIGGAVLGSLCLYSVARHFGHPFVLRFGRYVGLDHERLEKVERAFRRWGPLAIIVGRHIPGMRIYLSAFAGIFEVPLKIFIPSVAFSSVLWATIFIEIGRVLGRNSRYLFRLFPAHLFPLLLLGVMVLAALYIAYEHAWRPRARARAQARRARRRAEKGPPDANEENASSQS
jgi:membrane protein DedA with SNARE-associated domain